MTLLSLHVIILAISITFAIVVLIQIFPPRGVKQITVNELADMLEDQDNDYQYIDIRPAKQFQKLHVYGFKNIPLNDLKKEIDTLSKDKKVVVMCQRGIYGNEACKILKRQGFSDLANVRGGVVTWEPHE